MENLNISEEKKQYIIQQLNPILEDMVAECIHRMPEDPVPFMLDYLEQKRCSNEDKLLSPEQKERLLAENKTLQVNVEKVKSQMHEAVKLSHVECKDEEEEEEESSDDEMPDDWVEMVQTKSRTSVSAEAYGDWNKKTAFVPPVVPKTDLQKDSLKATLSKSVLFSSLEANEVAIIVGAMREVNAEAGQRVINQGDEGDFLFVIESGALDCSIKDGDGEKLVHSYKAGEVFGELALLYNCPRQASIDAKDKCTLWQLDRETFNHIVKEAAQKKRTRYEVFLQKVPLLANMGPHERAQLSDALKSESFAKGQTIMKQGEEGRTFYIIEEGEAAAYKNETQVMSYGPGDYFGELALIRNQPRAATVTCSTVCKVLSIESNSFKRLLNVSDLLERSTQYA